MSVNLKYRIPWQTDLFTWQTTWLQKWNLDWPYMPCLIVSVWQYLLESESTNQKIKCMLTLNTNERKWQQLPFQPSSSPVLIAEMNLVGNIASAMLTEILSTLFITDKWYCIPCSDQLKCVPFRAPYVWNFSFLRQIVEGTPFMQKCHVVWKLWYITLLQHCLSQCWCD